MTHDVRRAVSDGVCLVLGYVRNAVTRESADFVFLDYARDVINRCQKRFKVTHEKKTKGDVVR